MNGLLRRITKLESKKQAQGCPECERRSWGIRFVRHDGTPYRPQDTDICPACGKESKWGKLVGADPELL